MGKGFRLTIKSLLVNLSLILGSLGLGLLALEGILRLATPAFSLPLRQALLERATDEDLLHFVPGIGTMALPNLNRSQIRINDTEIITIKTDNDGFRNPTTPTQLDIAFLGDSFVWGFGVNREKTWVALTSKLTGHATASYGQSGFSAWQYEQVFSKYIAPRKPRLVIWSFFANDLDPVRDRIQSGGASPLQSLRVWMDYNSLLYRLVKFIIQGAYFSDQQPIKYKDQAVDFVLFPKTHTIVSPQDTNFQPGLTQFQDSLKAVQASCQPVECQLVVVLIPTKEMVYFPRVNKVFSPEQFQLVKDAFATYQEIGVFLKQNNLLHYDLTEDFQKNAQKQLYFRIDGHWNAEGHRFAAQGLEAFLVQENLLKSKNR